MSALKHCSRCQGLGDYITGHNGAEPIYETCTECEAWNTRVTAKEKMIRTQKRIERRKEHHGRGNEGSRFNA